MLLCDEYLTPASLDEAFDAMDAHRGRHRLVAGATDTLPWAREGRAGDVEIPVLIDVANIPELSERTRRRRARALGAATPIQRFLDDPALGRALPCMPRCAVWFADDQIRESATIGGNIVNASPAADGTPAADRARGERGAGGAARRQDRPPHACRSRSSSPAPARPRCEPGELLVAIECDALPGYGGSFEKVGHRRSLVISLVCLAALVKLDAAGRAFEDVRLAIGGIGPVPQRLAEVEAFLRGGPVSAERLEQAADMPVDLVPSRTRQAYRREVVRGFMLRGLINAVRRAGGDPTRSAPELEAAYA